MRYPDDVTILRATAADEYGNPARDWTAPTEIPAKAFVSIGARHSLGHSTLTAKALFPVGTDVRAGDRLRHGTTVYDIEAPHILRSPSKPVLVSAGLSRVEG